MLLLLRWLQPWQLAGHPCCAAAHLPPRLPLRLLYEQEMKARTKLAVSGQFNALDLNKVR